MAEKKNLISRTKIVACDSMFGRAPLLDGEDSEAYDAMLLKVSSAVKPVDAIEEIWVRDVVYLSWEIFRWRRIKVALASEAIAGELTAALAPFFRLLKGATSSFPVMVRPKSLYKLVRKWSAGDSAARKRVDHFLASANLTMGTIVDRAYSRQLNQMDMIERYTANMENRRNAILREYDRRRLVAAQILRDKLTKVDDAEFETIEGKAVAHKNPRIKKKAA